MFCMFLVITAAVLKLTVKVKHVMLSLKLHPSSPTSVAWSVWSLMLMKVCSSLSSPSLSGGSNMLRFCRTLGLGDPRCPHKLSLFVSLSLESFRTSSGCLGAPLERMLRSKNKAWNSINNAVGQSMWLCLTVKKHPSLLCCISDNTDRTWLTWPPSARGYTQKNQSHQRSPPDWSRNPRNSALMCLHLRVPEWFSGQLFQPRPIFLFVDSPKCEFNYLCETKQGMSTTHTHARTHTPIHYSWMNGTLIWQCLMLQNAVRVAKPSQ